MSNAICHCGKDGHALNSVNCPVHAERVNGWVFAKRLSDSLLKIRPLGGSELFVKRNGEYYADPDYCGTAIEDSHKRYHETMMENVQLVRRVRALEAAISFWKMASYPEIPPNPHDMEGRCQAQRALDLAETTLYELVDSVAPQKSQESASE